MMQTTQIIDNIEYQKCTLCFVKYPVDKYNPNRKYCDGCQLRRIKENKVIRDSNPNRIIRRLPLCDCGEKLHKMTIQTRINKKKVHIDTKCLYCINCDSVLKIEKLVSKNKTNSTLLQESNV